MDFDFEDRPSDSPFVERVWRTHSERAGTFTSIAATNWEMVVTTARGKTTVTVRGPETRATPADSPADAEFFGIVFKLGAFMPDFPAARLIDRNDATLPEAAYRSFWLAGSTWQLPDYDNADTFVSRLARQGLLVRDGLVEAVLHHRTPDASIRTVRRRFLRATGLTPGAIHQIERARRAKQLLQNGTSILDTVFEAGYYDQPHLTRAIKHFVGQTPAQIAATSLPEPVSLLYNTGPETSAIMSGIQSMPNGELT